MLPVLSPQNTSSSLTSALTSVLANISATYPNEFLVSISNVTEYPTFYDWWSADNGPYYAGFELVIGSRLLSADALQDVAALETAVKGVLPSELGGVSINFYLLGGKGVADAVPRGGSDAVNPAWRKAVVHAGSYHSPIPSQTPTNRKTNSNKHKLDASG